MSQGRSIRLFLVDGTPNGLLTAEIMNWTGHVLSSPGAAAAVVLGRNANGRTEWTLRDNGQTYAAWQEQQVAALKPAQPVLTPTE